MSLANPTSRLNGTRADGAQRVEFLRNGEWIASGWLMPQIDQTGNRAIQSWSKKGGSTAGLHLADGGASILSFSDAWARKHQRSYPYADPMASFITAAKSELNFGDDSE